MREHITCMWEKIEDAGNVTFLIAICNSRIRGSRACLFSATARKGPAPGRTGIYSGLSTSP